VMFAETVAGEPGTVRGAGAATFERHHTFGRSDFPHRGGCHKKINHASVLVTPAGSGDGKEGMTTFLAPE
jgi:hypothetical protein